jgi:hypothetical protein
VTPQKFSSMLLYVRPSLTIRNVSRLPKPSPVVVSTISVTVEKPVSR